MPKYAIQTYPCGDSLLMPYSFSLNLSDQMCQALELL